MYKKYLIVVSKKDLAGTNIATQLSQYRENPMLSSMKDKPGFDFYLVEEDILHTENIDLEKINRYDFVIFASKHSSKKEGKTLSVHAPGNWGEAKFGGEPKRVCKTSASFSKQLFEKLQKKKVEHHLNKYELTMEATHHGPLIEKPCVFIEIGSTETEWKDRRAGFAVAQTILETINEFKENPYNEVAIAIGGPHYCQGFNKLQLKSNLAISHVIPQYALPLTEEMMKEAIEKTEEEVDFIVIDWKGLGNTESRKQVTEILDKLYLEYKRSSKINR